MKLSRLNILALVLIAMTVVVSALFQADLPDPVPTHWNAAGEVDGWTPKPWGVWLWPALTAGLYALLLVLPWISPKGFRLDSARRVYDIVAFVLVAFLAAIQLTAFLDALGKGPGVAALVPVLLGLLFIVLGNYLGKFPKNFFVGIRTPWTLASDEVWNRTHRLGGWLFMGAGALLFGSAFFGFSRLVVIAVVAVTAAVPLLYSLFLYRKLHGFRRERD